MQCDYFDAGACRSCTLMGTPYGAQLAAKDAAVRAALAAVVPAAAWQWPQDSRPEGFRNKAKLVVGGTRGAVTVRPPHPLPRRRDARAVRAAPEGAARAAATVAVARSARRTGQDRATARNWRTVLALQELLRG